jgi:GT2 family glycosyltransferase
MRISASVINWNNRDCIVRCLNSLFLQAGVELDPVLIDNGSQDGSLDLVREHFPNIKIILAGTNLGFSAAHNLGYRATKGEWHFVLNSDVELEKDYLLKCAEAGADSGVGSVTGKLLRFEQVNGQNIIDSAGIEMFASRRVWDRGAGQIDHGQFDKQEEVFGSCGAAAIYRRSMLEQISPDGEIFAEVFFAYYEDVDLAWRIAEAGWRHIYQPAAQAKHVRGGSTKGSATTRKLVFCNRYVLLARNESFSSSIRNIGPILFFEIFQCLRVCRYPSLILSIPHLIRSVARALRERKAMKQDGRHFGLGSSRKFLVSGAGISSWLKRN